MVVGKVTVTNPTGIHARTATNLSSVCMNCESRVELRIGQNIIDPKNMLGLLEKQIKCGTELEVLCNGETEVEDLKTVVAFIESGMGELA